MVFCKMITDIPIPCFQKNSGRNDAAAAAAANNRNIYVTHSHRPQGSFGGVNAMPNMDHYMEVRRGG